MINRLIITSRRICEEVGMWRPVREARYALKSHLAPDGCYSGMVEATYDAKNASRPSDGGTYLNADG